MEPAMPPILKTADEGHVWLLGTLQTSISWRFRPFAIGSGHIITCARGGGKAGPRCGEG